MTMTMVTMPMRIEEHVCRATLARGRMPFLPLSSCPLPPLPLLQLTTHQHTTKHTTTTNRASVAEELVLHVGGRVGYSQVCLCWWGGGALCVF